MDGCHFGMIPMRRPAADGLREIKPQMECCYHDMAIELLGVRL